MSIHMIGIDHTKANVDTRALFSFTKKSCMETMAEWKSIRGIFGVIIISTCNRMEIWASTEDEWEGSLLELLCAKKQVREKEYETRFTVRKDREAVCHLFWLACGLKSQILAEDQILTQVKDALALSRENFTTDSVLEVLFRTAITAAKRVKTEVAFSRANETAMDQAIYMLGHNGFPFKRAVCMVIGNGEMGKLAALALRETGADVTVTVRQYRSGVVEIPQGCSRIHYGERMNFLPECDLVVSATASPNYTLTEKLVREALVKRRGRPLIFVDLAVPRDIETSVGELPNVTLYNIDDFKLDRLTDSMKASMDAAEIILEEEMGEFYGWLDNKKMLPRIQKIKDFAVEDFQWRIQKEIKKLPLEPEQKEQLRGVVDAAAGKVVAKLLFGLRDSLEKGEFFDCLEGLEELYKE